MIKKEFLLTISILSQAKGDGKREIQVENWNIVWFDNKLSELKL